jgi:hypothetical protein
MVIAWNQFARVIADLLDGVARRARVAEPSLGGLVVAIVVAGAVYGAAMGGWRVFEDDRWQLAMFGAIKSPLLIMTTSVVVLPAFFVLNTVAGLRDDFRDAMRAILVGQAGLTIALASLAPVTQFIYFTGVTHRMAILTNAVMFTIAAVVAQFVMLRWYRVLIAKDRRHLLMLLAWLVLYAFVGMQMGWMLRPFIGDPTQSPAFFREEPFTNAYVFIFRLIFG